LYKKKKKRKKKDIRSWFGLINQVSYAFSMTERMLPFREFLKQGTPFHWNDQLDELLVESKRVIVSKIQGRPFIVRQSGSKVRMRTIGENALYRKCDTLEHYQRYDKEEEEG
jgi:hypothetical protein